MGEVDNVLALIIFIFAIILVGTISLIIQGNIIGYAFLMCIFAIIWIGNKVD